MSKELIKIIGKENINGMEFTSIEGGFGKYKKSMLAKDIALIHNRELKKINELINNNRKRFKDGIDILDFLSPSEGLRDFAKENGLIGSNRTKNIYLLSERGYSKLLKIMDDDLAWEKYDELVDGYFNMRKLIKEETTYKLPQTYKEALLQLVEQVEENEKLQLENKNLNIENSLLQGEKFEWAGTNLINALVRKYSSTVYGDFAKGWTDFKKNILYKYGININSRITAYLNKTCKKTKPKTLSMLKNDEEISQAIITILTMCKDEDVKTEDIIKHYKEDYNNK